MKLSANVLSSLALYCLVATLSGCGSKLPKTIPVEGKVTFDGGQVPGPGFIYFNTLEPAPGSPSRPGTAEFDAEGNYRAQTYVPGDGLLPGKYVLRVDCYQTPPNMEGKPVKSYLPNRYQDASKSGLELTVETNAKRLKFDVPLTSK